MVLYDKLSSPADAISELVGLKDATDIKKKKNYALFYCTLVSAALMLSTLGRQVELATILAMYSPG